MKAVNNPFNFCTNRSCGFSNILVSVTCPMTTKSILQPCKIDIQYILASFPTFIADKALIIHCNVSQMNNVSENFLQVVYNLHLI